MTFAKWWREHTSLPTVADQLKSYEEENAYSNAALGAETHTPEPAVITAGRVIQAEYFPPHTGIVIEGILCHFTEYLLDRHFILLGEVGSGKTTAIHTLAQQTVRNTNRDIFALDFKGKYEDAQELRAIIAEKRENVRIVQLDPDNPGWPYNPFKYGDGLALSNRWARAFGIERTIGRIDEYYGSLTLAVILLICNGGAEPPRSLQAFEARMNEKWLNDNYPPNHPRYYMKVMVTTAEKGQRTALQQLQVRAMSIFLQLERFITEDGWTPDDGSGVISVPASKIPDTAQIIAALMVEDFKHFMSARQTRPCQIFWDEFQAARNESITELLSQSRSFHCGAVLATQDINKLGTELQQKALTSDTTTMIAFRTQQSADFVARLSGSIKQARTTIQVQEDEVQRYSVGEETEYRIHPNDVAQLPDGYCFILRQRTYAKVLFNQPVIPVNVSPEPVPPVISKTETTAVNPTLREKPKKKPKVNERT